MSVGKLEGPEEELFQEVVQVAFLDDSTVAVMDRLAVDIRLFDLDGEFVRRLGGQGEGPGEFRQVNGMWVPSPDTIKVIDLGMFRITALLADGSSVSTTPIHYDFSGRPDHLVGAFPDGGFVVGGAWFGDTEGEIVPDRWYHHSYGSDGEFRGHMGEHEGVWRLSSGSLRSHPLSPWISATTFSDSLLVSVAKPPWLRVIGPDGAFARAIPVPDIQVQVGEAMAEVSASLKAAGSSWANALDDVPLPERVPLISRILIDDQGLIWAKRYEPAEDHAWGRHWRRAQGGDWWVIDRAGDLVAVASIPRGFAPLDVRADLVVGTVKDAFDVERVQVRRIAR